MHRSNEIPSTVRLTPMMRRFYAMRFVEGLPQATIAARLGITQPAVSRRERRVVERFEQAGITPPVAPGRFLVRVGVYSFNAMVASDN